MPRAHFIWRVALSVGVMAAAAPSAAQTPAEFFKGKDVRILIGSGVGGTYGLYGLLASRHLRKHVPGEPNIVIQSMPGGGGMNAVNYSYNAAPKDGSVMHLVHAEVLFETLLTPGVKFNAQKYQWLGRMADADFVGLVSKRSGVTSLDDARKRTVIMGSTGARAVAAIGPRLLNRSAGTRFNVIAGWKGTSDIYIAIARGEVDGVAVSWANALSIHGAAMAKGDLVPIFTVGEKRLAALPNVPSVTEFGGSEDERTFASLYTAGGVIGRSLVYPPGVPRDRVDAMREAFSRMLADPEFQAEVKARAILLAPMGWKELAAFVDRLMQTPAGRIEAARKIYAELLAAKAK